MSGTPFEQLVHRVNNLLGTIEVQAEVARGEGSLAAFEQALDHIHESAKRVRHDVQRLRAVANGRAEQPGPPKETPPQGAGSPSCG
jgi:hypothetical protein